MQDGKRIGIGDLPLLLFAYTYTRSTRTNTTPQLMIYATLRHPLRLSLSPDLQHNTVSQERPLFPFGQSAPSVC